MSSSSTSIASAPSSAYGSLPLEALGQSHPLQAQRYRLLSELDSWFYLGSETSTTLAKLVADYAQKVVVFGPRDYRTHYGVDVGDDVLPEEDRIWWNSLDAISLFDQQGNPMYNYETHHGFHYIPASCKPLTERAAHIFGVHVGEEVPLDIENHARLAAEPEVGHPSRLRVEDGSLRLNKRIRSATSTSCWIAQRKWVLFRDETTVKQRAMMQELNTETEAQMQAMSVQLGTRYGNLTGTRYENLPDLRDLSLIARNHLAKTGERILGDRTGFEKCWTYSRTEQQVTCEDGSYQLEVGGQTPFAAGVVGRSSPSGGLLVNVDEFDCVSVGVAGLRKSLVHRPLVD